MLLYQTTQGDNGGRPVLRKAAGVLWIVAAFLGGCAGSDGSTNAPLEKPLPLRIYSSPYAAVDWTADFRLRAQLHDHQGTTTGRIAAYDAAGYDVITLSDYSGNRTLPYAWTSRHWPAEAWLTPTFIASLRNIKILLPGAEEVGFPDTHITSSFLDTYIERWTPDMGSAKQSNQYETVQEMLSLIQSRGGIPCIAHPWNGLPAVSSDSPLCTEVYSAFAAYRTWQGTEAFFKTDRAAVLLSGWDTLLQRNQSVIGVSVNDHFGPYSPIADLPDFIRDSGKIVVLSKAVTAPAFKEAFSRGAVFAIRDYGVTKNRYPLVNSIYTDETSIEIDTTDRIEWVTGGALIGTGRRLESTSIPQGSRYVRAEISNMDGSMIFTQAFRVRPVGDVDGDYDVDSQDQSICWTIQSNTGNAFPAEQVAACQSR